MDVGESRPIPDVWLTIALAVGVFVTGAADPAQSGASYAGESPYAWTPGWADDDHAAAYAAFRKTCIRTLGQRESTPASAIDRAVRAICREALAGPAEAGRAEARRFFETHFTPYRIRPSGEALLTGYFEPDFEGSLSPSTAFPAPVYRAPPDLVSLGHEAAALGLPPFLTAARRTAFGYQPYYTRRQIERGALRGRGLEILYLGRPRDVYVMQMQGSGVVRLREGGKVRLGFAAKNGYPYTRPGRRLAAGGENLSELTALEKVFDWIMGDPSRERALLSENESYVFFRKLTDEQARQGPHGAFGAPLTAGRSLAIDPRYHRYGLPIWVYAPALRDERGAPFARLMVAEDTGSAIRGPVRGDVFWGTGTAAGALAGRTRHPCAFYVLWPQAAAVERKY